MSECKFDCDCGYHEAYEGLHCPHEMAKLLSEKLTPQEYSDLALLIDEDPVAGPFWEAIQGQNMKLNSTEYENPDALTKKEVSSFDYDDRDYRYDRRSPCAVCSGNGCFNCGGLGKL